MNFKQYITIIFETLDILIWYFLIVGIAITGWVITLMAVTLLVKTAIYIVDFAWTLI